MAGMLPRGISSRRLGSFIVFLVIRVVLVDQCFSRCSLFFPKKTEKQEKQEIFSKVENLTEGTTFGRIRIQIFEKMVIMEIQNFA